MRTEHRDDELLVADAKLATITGSDRRTLEAVFHHPMAHDLDWDDLLALIRRLGDAHEQSNNEFVFELAGRRHIMDKPHTRFLTGEAVLDVRQFILKAGFSPARPSQAAADPTPAAPDLLIVADHQGAKIFRVDVSSDNASEHVIAPYDPHRLLHHLVHKDQSERGQRAPEEPAYYERIADAAALGGNIVVVGQGTSQGDAAHHLVDYLKAHHNKTYRRVVREIVTNLSDITQPQLLDLASQALRK